MSFEIVGREDELRTIDAFLDNVAKEPTGLVLQGEPGIGKTTLWQKGVEAASSRAGRVLSTRPAEAERDLPYVGLRDLLEDVLPIVSPALPVPRRHALEVALLLREAEEPVSDARALPVAVHTVFGVLADAGPLVVAIDDVQWLDGSSARALEFAFRRLSNQPLRVLLSSRANSQERTALERALPQPLASLQVEPLSLGAIQRLVQIRLGQAFARPVLLRLHEASGGNPYFALELAQALHGQDAFRDPAEPLPVPTTLEHALGDRLGVLPDETRTALLTVAALGEPAAALVHEAGVTDDALAPAYAADVIERTRGGTAIRFAHPLLASTVYAGASDVERRSVHRRLADVAAEPLSRARHLALGFPEPSAQRGSELERAAARARDRGTAIVAAELAELAARSTPPDAPDDAHRRALHAAHDHMTAGDPGRAEALVRQVLADEPRGVRRAEALALLGELDLFSGKTADCIRLFEQALEESGGNPALEALIHERLVWVVRLNRSPAEAERHVRRSLELAERLGNTALRARALAAQALFRRSVGGLDALTHARRAVSLAEQSGDASALDEARGALADVLLWTGRFEEARLILERLGESAGDRDETAVGTVHWHLSILDLYVGHWDSAAEHADRCMGIGSLYAVDEGDVSYALFPAALVAAHRDDARVARRLARRGVDLAETNRQPVFVVNHRVALGIVEFREGDPLAAVESFEVAEALRRSKALLLEPNMRIHYGDFVEALLELGRIDDAVALLEPWGREAERLGREWALAHITRCRGLVAAATGDTATALRLLEDALTESSAAGPFGTARAALALGVVRRRARQKRAAREALEHAIRGFDSLGAPHWSKRAASELARVGGRVPAGSELTPAEQRVAELVAEGKTNREVAAALYLAERTVEGHLSHIYAKLGVRSRTELARRLT